MAFNYLSEKVTYRKYCLKMATLTVTPLREKENTFNGNLSFLKNISPSLKVELEYFSEILTFI